MIDSAYCASYNYSLSQGGSIMPSIVFQHHSNGTDYAYLSTSYWDKEKKASRTKMICIGKKDPDTGKIIYNRKWQELQKGKKSALSESESPEVSSTISIGPPLLLESVTKSTGLKAIFTQGIR